METYQRKLFNESRDAWQCAYNILRAYGRDHERAIAVLKGDPNQELYYADYMSKRLERANIAQNKPFIGHSWQV